MFQNIPVGEMCPNSDCPDYGRRQVEQSRKNVIKFGHSRAEKQRYKCLTCGRTFPETTGTMFYRRRTTTREILDAFAQMAEGSRLSSVARVTGHKADTISDWVKAAATHAEALEELLLREYQIEEGHLDGLWSYVSHKGEKSPLGRPTTVDNSSGRP